MNKQEYQDKLQSLINELEEKLNHTSEDDKIERIRLISIQNGLLQARLWSYELDNTDNDKRLHYAESLTDRLNNVETTCARYKQALESIKKDLERRIKRYKDLIERCYYGNLSMAYEKIIDELEDIQKDINL